MNKNAIIISVASILATFLLLFGVYKLVNKPEITDFPQTKTVKADDHTKWSPEKKNILVEYSDFQCPSCKSFHDILKTFDASGSPDLSISKNLTLVYRYYPLVQIHDKANISAYAAESAGLQGKFWEMGNLLFDNQPVWSVSKDPEKEYFTPFAKKLNLDVERFTKDMNSEKVKSRVSRDMLEAQGMNVNSTPTFFLNGQKVDVNSFDEFKKMLKNLN